MKSRSANARMALGLALLAGAFLAMARPVGAALGDTVASVEGDRLRLRGTLRTVPMPGYLLHEVGIPTGTVVREFSSPAGAIFAVSWEGPFLPDLRQLLGSSYESYLRAARAKRTGRGPLLLHQPELVFESAGHPRGFRGRAYIPSLVPGDVAADSLR